VDGTPISAMPFLDELLSQELHDVRKDPSDDQYSAVACDFVSGYQGHNACPIETSGIVRRGSEASERIFRWPWFVRPVHLSREGLLQVLAEVQSSEHGRAGQYSMLVVDVIYWNLLRLYYSYSVWQRFGRTS